MSKPNPDAEPDVELDRQKMIQELHKKYGDNLRVLLVISDVTGVSLLEVCDVWQANGQLIHRALGR